MEPKLFIDILVTHVFPFLAFLGGVLIGQLIGLHPNLENKHVWLMSVPTGLVITGILISSAATQVGDTVYFGYMSLEKQQF